MIRPDPPVVKAMAVAVRQHPELLQWVQTWYMHELAGLPSATNNVALKQGRCQVLGELAEFMKNSPDLAAKQ